MNAYPHFPGHRLTDTSHDAAQAIAAHMGRLQSLTYAEVLQAGLCGLTGHEAAARLGIDRTAIQPRLSELRLKGLIYDSGQRRKNASGKSAIVWIAGPGLNSALPCNADSTSHCL